MENMNSAVQVIPYSNISPMIYLRKFVSITSYNIHFY